MEGEGKEIITVAGQPACATEPTREGTPIYVATELNAELRQGEIISNLIQHVFNSETELTDPHHLPLTIVLSQDCDLLQDFNSRKRSKGAILNGVLLYEIRSADEFRVSNPATEIRKSAIQNKNERYHFLEMVPAALDLIGDGVPEMIIDFKRFFTLPAAEIERQINSKSAQRRCRLQMPYREHLQNRAAYFSQRVMLPLVHQVAVQKETAKPPQKPL